MARADQRINSRSGSYTGGEKQQSVSPFLPGKVLLGHGTLLALSFVPLANNDDEFVIRATVKLYRGTNYRCSWREDREEAFPLPGKDTRLGSRTRGLRDLVIGDQRTVRNP